MPPGAPIPERERLDVLDALRGFALVGILAANLLVFTGVIFLDPTARAAMPYPGLDTLVSWLQVVLIEGKFYGLFSLLFGIGAAMFIGRPGATDGVRRFRRRMLVLVGIGVVHSLIWVGDILLLYALLGLLLPLVRGWDDRRLLRLAAACFLLAAVWEYLVFGVTAAVGLPMGWPFSIAFEALEPLIPEYIGAVTRGDLPEMLRTNLLAVFLERWPSLLATARPLKVFGFFVLGLAAGRSVIVAAIPAHRPLLRRVATWGLVIGLPANLLFAAGRLTTDPVAWGLLPLAESVGILAMTLGYAAGFALVWDRHRPWLAEQLQPLGRMALTCYLTQTLICQYGLSGLGLGWFLEVGAATATALVVPVLVLQWGFARWWLGRYRFGPVEWAWRSLTYGRAQPMRR